MPYATLFEVKPSENVPLVTETVYVFVDQFAVYALFPVEPFEIVIVLFGVVPFEPVQPLKV